MLNPRVFRDAAKRIHTGRELYVHSAVEGAVWAAGMSGLDAMDYTRFFRNIFESEQFSWYCCTQFDNPYIQDNQNNRILALLFAAYICESGGL